MNGAAPPRRALWAWIVLLAAIAPSAALALFHDPDIHHRHGHGGSR